MYLLYVFINLFISYFMKLRSCSPFSYLFSTQICFTPRGPKRGNWQWKRVGKRGEGRANIPSSLLLCLQGQSQASSSRLTCLQSSSMHMVVYLTPRFILLGIKEKGGEKSNGRVSRGRKTHAQREEDHLRWKGRREDVGQTSAIAFNHLTASEKMEG